MPCCRSRSRASCLLPLRRPQSAAPLRPSTAAASTRTKSSSRLPHPTSRLASAAAYPQRRHVTIPRQRRERRAYTTVGGCRSRIHPDRHPFSHLLSALPQPVLAAVVLMAVVGLFEVSALKHLWYASRPRIRRRHGRSAGRSRLWPFARCHDRRRHLARTSMHRTSRPHVAILGRIPGTRRFSDMERHPDNEVTPGALIFRPESSLVYFNIDHICTTILDRVRQQSSPAPSRRA